MKEDSWQCPKCGKSVPDEMSQCWSCGTGRDGSPPVRPHIPEATADERLTWQTKLQEGSAEASTDKELAEVDIAQMLRELIRTQQRQRADLKDVQSMVSFMYWVLIINLLIGLLVLPMMCASG